MHMRLASTATGRLQQRRRRQATRRLLSHTRIELRALCWDLGWGDWPGGWWLPHSAARGVLEHPTCIHLMLRRRPWGGWRSVSPLSLLVYLSTLAISRSLLHDVHVAYGFCKLCGLWTGDSQTCGAPVPAQSVSQNSCGIEMWRTAWWWVCLVSALQPERKWVRGPAPYIKVQEDLPGPREARRSRTKLKRQMISTTR